MPEAEWQDDDEEISLFALGAIVLRSRRSILVLMGIGLLVAVVPVLRQPLMYAASASFVPQGNDAGRSGLASLAGQFGVSLSSGGPSQSPDFYVALLKSRELLLPIARDTLVVAELDNKRIALLDLFEINSGSPQQREEAALGVLSGITSTGLTRLTGVVDVRVATRWPSVSLAIATKLLTGINDFNSRSRQTQAVAERRFVEGRLAVARADLRAAEDLLERFLQANKQYVNSPSLAFEHDRLQRVVMQRQQVYNALAQSFEDARIREVRDTPVITVVESPRVPTRPMPRGRAKRAVLGMVFGGVVAMLWAFASAYFRRQRETADPGMVEFLGTLRDVRQDGLRLLGRRPRPASPGEPG